MAWRDKPPQPDIVHNDISGAEKRLSKLKRSFSRISRRWDRPIRRKEFYRTVGLPTVVAIGSFAFVWYLLSSPWGVVPTLKHLAAFPNCRAAEAVGLAPANIGQPGYWPHHDRDNDGIACEAAAWHSRQHGVAPSKQRWVTPPLR
jgi:Excalibur calcium-binding domain